MYCTWIITFIQVMLQCEQYIHTVIPFTSFTLNSITDCKSSD